MLYESNISLKVIQEWLGHSDSMILSIYTYSDYRSKVSSANVILAFYLKTTDVEAARKWNSLKCTTLESGELMLVDGL